MGPGDSGPTGDILECNGDMYHRECALNDNTIFVCGHCGEMTDTEGGEWEEAREYNPHHLCEGCNNPLDPTAKTCEDGPGDCEICQKNIQRPVTGLLTSTRLLDKYGACDSDTDKFELLFPDGAELTFFNAARAWNGTCDVLWLTALLTANERGHYEDYLRLSDSNWSRIMLLILVLKTERDTFDFRPYTRPEMAEIMGLEWTCYMQLAKDAHPEDAEVE